MLRAQAHFQNEGLGCRGGRGAKKVDGQRARGWRVIGRRRKGGGVPEGQMTEVPVDQRGGGIDGWRWAWKRRGAGLLGGKGRWGGLYV